jgi:hypothetical protein
MYFPLPHASRRLFGAALLASLLSAVSLPSAAQSSPGSGIAQLGSTTCSFTSVTTFPDGGVVINCGAVTPPTPGAATVTLGALNPNPIDPVTGGTSTLPVTCSGTCDNLVVSLASSSAPVVPVTPSTITFTKVGSQPATITVPANSGAGDVQITLTVTSLGTATSSTPAQGGTLTTALTIGAALPPPPPPPPGTCNTTATRTVDATGSGTIFYAIAGASESSAVKFTPTRGTMAQLQIQTTMPATATNKPAPTGYTMTTNIAECPGDFTTALNSGGLCGPRTTTRNSGVVNTSTIDATKCLLDPAKTYFFNVRFTNSTGANTCAYGGSGACAVGVNLTYQ